MANSQFDCDLFSYQAPSENEAPPRVVDPGYPKISPKAAKANPVSRICTTCKLVKPLTDFTPRTGGKYGRKAKCKDCENAASRVRYADNPEKFRENRRKSHQINKEKENAKGRARRIENPERSKLWDKTSRENLRDARNAYSRNWYDANREEQIAKALAWQAENPERFLTNVKKNNAVRKSRKRATEGKMTRKEWDAMLDYYNHCCAYCLRPESETGTLEIDHMVPICRGGTSWPENCAPACRSCNSSKLHRTPMEFLSRLCDRAAIQAAKTAT